ncbi:hypothetical protein [Clostridium muellerianum]|nr:hypothetical protein [Clostridium muellerianum]
MAEYIAPPEDVSLVETLEYKQDPANYDNKDKSEEKQKNLQMKI